MNQFEVLDNPATEEMGAVVNTNVKDAKKVEADAAKEALLKEMQMKFVEASKADPTLIEKCKSGSDNLAIIKTLGYSDKGDIIADKSQPKERKG